MARGDIVTFLQTSENRVPTVPDCFHGPIRGQHFFHHNG